MKCKWLAIALAMCLMMSMAGCGSKNNETTAAQDSAAEETTGIGIMNLPEYNAADHVGKTEYVGVEVTVENKVVTDAEFEEAIQYLLDEYTVEEQITDRVTAEGDTIVFDYSGAIDGVALDSGTATYQTTTLDLTSHNWIDGFEEGLIGKACGEEFVIEGRFDDDYGDEKLNGKTAQFTILIHYIEGDLIVPELNDAFVQELEAYGATTVAEFKDAYYADLSQQKADYMDDVAMDEVWSTILENTEFTSLPDLYVETYVQDMLHSYETYATMYGMTLENFAAMYGMTLEELETEVAAMAEAQVMTEVLYQYIAEKEGLVATEEDYLEMVAQYMEAYGYTDMTSFVNDYGVDVVEKQGYADATFQLVREFCYDKAIKTEAPAEETTASAE